MTVLELINLLEDYPDNWVVALSRDGEGNGFRLVSDTSGALWDGEDALWEEEDEEGDWEYKRIPEDRFNAVVLWPVY